MAAKSKEGIHLKEKASSAPSIPRRTEPSGHVARRTTAGTADKDTTLREKPTPNYLRHTISSCPDQVCRYPCRKHVAASEAPPMVATRKPLPAARKPTSAKSPSHKASSPPALPRPKPSSFSKPGKSSALHSETTRNLSKGTKKPKAEPEEKVLSVVDVGTCAKGSPKKQRSVPKFHDSYLDKKDGEEEMHYEGSEESLGGEELTSEDGEGGRPRARVSKWKEEEEMCKVLKMGEKEPPPLASAAHNEVIEETAIKLAGKRRCKVKALVGAFETVISLQEPEVEEKDDGGAGQRGQKEEEGVAAAAAKNGEILGLGEHGQPGRQLEGEPKDGEGLGEQSRQDDGEDDEKAEDSGEKETTELTDSLPASGSGEAKELIGSTEGEDSK